MKHKRLFLGILIFFVLFLVGCETPTRTKEVLNLDLAIFTSDDTYYEGDSIIVNVEVGEKDCFNNVYLSTSVDATIIQNVVVPTTSGELTIYASVEGYQDVKSNEITLEILPSIYDEDPYQNVTKEEFYQNYEESINALDSYYRTQHGFMSGDITLPDERPLLASYQPKEDGVFVRNTNTYYSEDKQTYYITDAYGEIVDVIYYNAGYISLDEVASYLLAFGYIPANHIEKKSGSPTSSIWGEYLRLNLSAFSGSTSKYPYEPELPNISGCGGDLYYYEVDFGTSGTTSDPAYKPTIYNDGNKISRGAARLVYTRFDKNRNNIIDPNEKYVFYTYNHYNDFQEYLNYQNGWGEKFGNITGGGTISSKNDYNPTPYVEVIRKDLSVKVDLSTKTHLFITINFNIYLEKKKDLFYI